MSKAKISTNTQLYGPWYNWSGPITTFRLSLVLIAATILFLPLPVTMNDQVFGLLTIIGIYSILIMFLLLIKRETRGNYLQAILISVSMMIFVVSAAVVLDQEALAMLLLVPVLNSALRLSGRNLIIMVIMAAGCWVYLYISNELMLLQKLPEIVTGLILIGLVAVIIRSLRGGMDLANNRITTLSCQDELSNALNMRTFTGLILSVQAKAAETATSYALLMVDIENLQLLNEKYGHEQGNRVIVAVAEAIKRSIRTDDLLARYGGDEFIVCLPGASDSTAQEISNRISQNVYNITLSFESKMQRIQVNTGIAVYPDSGTTIQEMMAFADKSMYQDKEFRRSVKPAATSRDRSRAQAGIESY